MENYLIKFCVNGVFSERYIVCATLDDAKRLIKCQYGGQNVKILSAVSVR